MGARQIAVDVGSGQRTTSLLYPAQTHTQQPATLILAHGAGAPQLHPFMVDFARALSERGLDVLTFNFLYTEQRRKVPDRMPQLVACYRAVIETARADIPSAGERLFIGGKSMGGRMASLVADETGVRGLVCLGYPFHPPGQPGKTRTAHLAELRTPTLIVQGTRDTLGSREDVAGYELSPRIRIVWLEDGDHSFKPRKSSGHTEKQHLEAAVAAVAGFVRGA
jgi:hypothetical protein